MSKVITDVEVPYNEPVKKYAWTPAPPVYSEPWTPTEGQWKKLKGKVVPCECGGWHPGPYFTIHWLKQYVGLAKSEVSVPPPMDPYRGWIDRPVDFNEPW